MDLIKIAVLSLSSAAVLFILTKIMGDREMSELSMFDYITSITIGSIAAEMATSLEDDFRRPLLAMVIYGVVCFVISLLTCKSIKLRRFFEGHSLIMYQNGKLYNKNMLKAKIDVDEFLSMCRVNGYFDLSEIHTAILESNGKLSILPMAKNKPVTAEDLNLNPEQSFPMSNVIIDGKILKSNLQWAGKNEIWLEKQLSAQGIKDIKEVMLATCDSTDSQLNIYVKLPVVSKNDMFQ
ncbi:DUF421 domain-containing protein [Clostridium sp. KNHs205]|jgi:uncharacterized membrane protein YcaP (DUF421 family)|uniref:DUF421 domain-containing protein n=1 Tax=Clostridium sp. KNHs205 TaxID=1449050 RepID=UPI00051B195A|nr:DUF421 domain-containing protein [Clostridium sp. KNHs205]